MRCWRSAAGTGSKGTYGRITRPASVPPVTESQAVASQPLSQAFAASLQPALDHPEAQAKLRGGLVARFAFEITHHEQGAVFLRQPNQLPGQRGEHLRASTFWGDLL